LITEDLEILFCCPWCSHTFLETWVQSISYLQVIFPGWGYCAWRRLCSAWTR